MTRDLEHIQPSITRYLAGFQCFYPGILDWYTGLQEAFLIGRRRMFVLWNGSKVQGLAITKNGRKAKLCHVSVSKSVRKYGLGSFLTNLAIQDMTRQGAQEIYVTTSEEVYNINSSFFYAHGFRMLNWELHRYRKDKPEFFWRLDSSLCSKNISDNLPNNLEIYGKDLLDVQLRKRINQLKNFTSRRGQ